MTLFVNCINFIVYILAASLFIGLGLIVGGAMIIYELSDEWSLGLALLLVGIAVVASIFGLLAFGWFRRRGQVSSPNFDEKFGNASNSNYKQSNVTVIYVEPGNSQTVANGQIYSSPRI